MKKINLMLALIVPAMLFGQLKDTEWGTQSKKSPKKVLSKLIYKNDDKQLAIYTSNTLLPGSPKLVEFNNLNEGTSEKISIRVNNSMASYNDLFYIGDKLILALADNTKEEASLYFQEVSKDLLPVGEPKVMSSYQLEKKGAGKNDFDLYYSKDKEFFAIVTGTADANSLSKDEIGAESVRYEVFDKEMNMLFKDEYEFPPNRESFDLTSFYLSNSAELVMIIQDFKNIEYKKNGNLESREFNGYHIYSISESESFDFVLDIGSEINPKSFSLNSNSNGIYTVTGSYSEAGSGATDGIFFVKYDSFEGEILFNERYKFTDEFIRQDWTEKQNKKFDRKSKRKDLDPAMYSYRVIFNGLNENEEMVGVMEQYYVKVVTTTDSRGNTRTTYYYYYNDIIAYGVSKEGELNWINKLNKSFVSANDGGYFGSTAVTIDNNKVVLLFNDHIHNYENDKYTAGIEPKAAGSLKKTRAAIITYSAESGKMTREINKIDQPVKTFIIPKKTVFSPDGTRIYIPAVNRTKVSLGQLTL